ncbi:PilZ domain-containing protein [Sphingomonas qomolangmaensis]|uniref:PilZ domain-containing protein n=1 Tax=Sphingomonas qomolangmaensis TaxID=2918765 RepID=A0ABY5L6C7_9SPHN|nr:PilZ domain-containing protein [Sphingomonas qomolangmaensis]UUL82510.1 PilZ domain-containing protein [Sphingomonas qomolangmaensis]
MSDIAPIEQRTSNRSRTVLRIVKVRSAYDEGLARLKNISDGGAMLRLGIEVELGDAVTVFWTDDLGIDGRVAWLNGNICGIQFSSNIDSAALLADMAEHSRLGRGVALSLSTDTAGILSTEAGLHPIHVSNVSQRGMAISNQAALKSGLPVRIRLVSGLQRTGTVRWASDDIAEVELTPPLTLEDLQSSKQLGPRVGAAADTRLA